MPYALFPRAPITQTYIVHPPSVTANGTRLLRTNQSINPIEPTIFTSRHPPLRTLHTFNICRRMRTTATMIRSIQRGTTHHCINARLSSPPSNDPALVSPPFTSPPLASVAPPPLKRPRLV